MKPSEINYTNLEKIIKDIARSRNWFTHTLGLTNYIGHQPESSIGQKINHLNCVIEYPYIRIGIEGSKKYDKTKTLDWNIKAMLDMIRHKLFQINQYNNFKGAIIVFGERQAGLKHELKKYYL